MSGYGAPVRILAPAELAGRTGRVHRARAPLGLVIVRMDSQEQEYKAFAPGEIERVEEKEEAWVR